MQLHGIMLLITRIESILSLVTTKFREWLLLIVNIFVFRPFVA